MCNYQLPETIEFYHKLDEVTQLLENEITPKLQAYANNFVQSVSGEYSITTKEAMLELLIWKILYDRYLAAPAFTKNEQLLDILTQTGEYVEIAERLQKWLPYLSSLPQDSKLDNACERMCESVTAAVQVMMRLGNENFAAFFQNVEDFAKRMENERPIRKDIALVSRRLPEYYLNLFGAQMLNRIYAPQFALTQEKYVFLPGCMAKGGADCQAKKGTIGFQCIGCSDECSVNQISKLVHELSGEVTLFYHGSQINSALIKAGKTKGLIGIACIPNLLEGGYQAKRLGFVPQCVFLEFAGCKQHWNKKGVVTDCNKERIAEIITTT